MGKRSAEAVVDEQPPPVKGDDAQLLADIKQFVAELGFGTGGGGDDAFADFAPERAEKKVGKPATKQLRGGDGVDAPANTEPAANGRARDGKLKPVKQPAPAAPKPRAAAPALPAAPLAPAFPVGARPKSILQREEAGLWWEASDSLPRLAPGTAAPDAALAAQLKERSQQLLSNEAAAFDAASEKRGSGSDLRWLQQAQRGGTTSDKVAAMAVLVQEAPAANLRSLDGLIAMAGKRGGARAVVGSALDALRELWLEILLPPRKLRFFEQQPLAALSTGREGDRALLYWALEDALKKKYALFVDALESLTRDNLEFVKDRAVKTAYDLLSARPEQEAALLTLLVNKLGDPDRKLASKVGYLLTRLLAEHPGMKAVVVREVERFVFRPGLADRARYYAVVYLNQMVLTHRDATAASAAKAGGATLARRLVDLYFTLFKLVLEGRVGTAASLAAAKQYKARREAEAYAARRGRKKASAAAGAADAEEGGGGAAAGQHSGEMDARMLSALITGVRRAFPYVAAEEVEPLIEAHADALFRLIHTRSFGVATQALLLLLQLMTSRNSVSDRFYRALYSVLTNPELTRSTKGPMFLSLLFKALKADVSAKRAAAFAKRILQVASGAAPNFACGCLVLVSELLRARPGLWSAVLQAEDNADDGVEHFVDAPEQAAPAPGGGATAKQAKHRKAVAKVQLGGVQDNDSGSEGAAAGSFDEGSEGALQAAAAEAARTGSSRKQPAASAAVPADAWPASREGYDMRKRDPQYSHADRSCLWELNPLAAHAHPSVAAMARALLAGTNISYAGDPLRDLTLAAFLDKFVAKKPKAAAKGDSLMQPLRATAAAAAAGGQAGSAVSAAFAALAEKDVGPDDAFFHKYYSLQAVQSAAARAAERRRKKTAAKAAGGEEDEELVSDVEGSDSDGVDDFLAGEEAEGEEGIGADPDGATGYDYGALAAAMESDSDDGGEQTAGSGEEDSGLEGPGSGSDGAGGESGVSLEGAQFSDMSDKGGSDGSPARGSGEEEEGEELSELDSDSVPGTLDSLEDPSDADAGDDLPSSSEDDAAADAEVAALMKRLGRAGRAAATKRARGAAVAAEGAEEEEEEDAVNPFELAEPTDSDGSSGSGGGSDSDSDGGDSNIDDGFEEQGGSDSGGGRGDGQSIFAAAEDYEAMIDRDMLEEGGQAEGLQQRGRSGAGRGKRRRRQ